MPLPLSVRNNEGNTTVFAKSVGGDPVRITWGAKGTPSDTQRVPASLADDIDFLNTLERGALTVIDGPKEVVEALQFETSKQRQQRATQDQRAMDSIDRRQDRDMVGSTCIGPAPQGRSGNCGKPVLIAHKNLSEVPPLCGEHEDLAPTFFLYEEGSRGEGASQTRDGEIRREWRPVQMAERVTGR